MALGKKTGGRQKGSVNLKTKVRAVATAAVAADINKVRAKGIPAKARAGVSPKDLLLDTMRASWEAGHLLAAEAEALAKVAANMPEGAERAALSEKVANMRIAASLQIEQAVETATKVAPYEHAKLQNVDGKLVGNLYVNLKQF